MMADPKLETLPDLSRIALHENTTLEDSHMWKRPYPTISRVQLSADSTVEQLKELKIHTIFRYHKERLTQWQAASRLVQRVLSLESRSWV